MKNNFLFLPIGLLFMGCASSQFHNYADYNKQVAAETIQRLIQDTLIIVLPTYHKKEIQLKNIIKNKPSQKEQANQKLLNLYANREFRQEALINAFYDHYTFSYFLFIPDSLVTAFESDTAGAYFLNDYLEIDATIQYSNAHPIKFIERFEKEWHIMVGRKLVPNPFPNNFTYKSRQHVKLTEVPYKDVYTVVVREFQSRFEKFFSNPNRKGPYILVN